MVTKRKIKYVIMTSLALLTLTACSNNKKQETQTKQTQDKITTKAKAPVSKTMSQDDIKKLVNKATKVSTISGAVDIEMTNKDKKGSKYTENALTKYSSQSNSIYRKTNVKGDKKNTTIQIWAQNTNIYNKQQDGPWVHQTTKKAVTQKGIESNKASLIQTINSFTQKGVLPKVSTLQTPGPGPANGLVTLSYNVTTPGTSKGKMTATMVVDKITGEVENLHFNREVDGKTKTYFKAHFYDINKLNDLNIPQNVVKNAKNV